MCFGRLGRASQKNSPNSRLGSFSRDLRPGSNQRAFGVVHALNARAHAAPWPAADRAWLDSLALCSSAQFPEAALAQGPDAPA